VTSDDVLYRFRLRALALAAELGNVRAACRALGIHHSTFYRWQAVARRHGLELLRPRERRSPQMPNRASPMIEQRVLAFSLAHPGYGPARIASELARPKWGGIRLSPNGVWGVLRRHGLSTRARRLALVAGYAAPPEPIRPAPEPVRHIRVRRPGELVQMDCFCIGRLSGTKGTVWQYTAIDAYSSYLWAELHTSPRNPLARHTSHLAERVAAELAAPRLAPRGGQQRQRLRVHQPPVRPGARPNRRDPPAHPRGAAPVKRLRRAGPADGPR
jgi:transposase